MVFASNRVNRGPEKVISLVSSVLELRSSLGRFHQSHGKAWWALPAWQRVELHGGQRPESSDLLTLTPGPGWLNTDKFLFFWLSLFPGPWRNLVVLIIRLFSSLDTRHLIKFQLRDIVSFSS